MSNSGKMIWLLLAALVVFLALSFFLSERNVSIEKLTIANVEQPIAALIFVADAKGFFKDEGLEVTYQKFAAGKDALKSVIEGKADVATVLETPVVLQVLAGKPIRIISTLHRSSSNTSIIARRDRGIHQVADLRGKRIGVTENTNADYLLGSTLDNEGIPFSAVKIQHLLPNDNAPAFIKGEVDALATWSPHLGKAKNGLPAGTTIAFTSPLYTEISMLATLPETLVSKNEALRRFIRAIVRAEEFISLNNEDALNITIKYLADQPEAGIRETWRNVEFQARLDNLLVESMNRESHWFVEKSRAAGPAPHFNAVIADEFLNEIRPQLVTVLPVN